MIREVSSKSVEGQFSLGVDLGGTNLRVAAYRSGKQVAELISLPTRLTQGRERVIRDLKDAVIALRSRFQQHGESAGTGVGNGIILNDRIWHGNNGMAGEAGHLMVEPDGMACPCGGRGCVELYASATGVVRMAREANDPILTAALPADPASWTSHAVADAAIAGNATAIAIFERVGRAVGIAFAGVANMLNLPLYVVAGGVSNAWDLFAPAMFAEMRLRSYVYRPTAAAPGDRKS